MDTLLANYASSDEDEPEEQPPQVPRTAPPTKPEKLEGTSGADEGEVFRPNSNSILGGIFNSLPPPKSSLFNSLPPPISQSLINPKPEGELDREVEVEPRDENTKLKSSSSSSSASPFSSLPPPKSSTLSSSKAKMVVQFRPPAIAHVGRDDDEDVDEEERQSKRSKASLSTSSASSLWSTMPAPKNTATLGALPSASGTGRRSMLETNTQASNTSTIISEVVNANDGYTKDQSSDVVYDYSTWSSGSENHAYYSGYGSAPDGNVGNHSNEAYNQSNDLSGETYGYYGAYGVGSTAGDVNENPNPGSYEAADYSYGHDQNVGYTNYDAGYGDYGNNVQYENNWANVTALPEASGVIENVLQVTGRRGRKDVPAEIVEVKQDELIKNRPREDQVKVTGIAFGPAYQPASSKGKPTKLHKRKHQIGSLYFDMKQKESELSERRAQGFLTKAQTQAKYGW